MGVATAVETNSMESEAAVSSKSGVGGRSGSKPEVASLAHPNQWITLAKGPDLVVTAVGYSPQREQLRSGLEKQGEILPQTHEFSQLVQKASEKLGIPGQTEVVTVDTEEMIAFFNPRSQTVVFSRGFARHLQEELPKAGIQFSEDHIAAVIAHELEHAEVLGDDYVKKMDESFWERLKASFSHAEEYRADAAGMRRLARAKYNPNAMIEIFKSFSLTMGRSDISHPEIIDRIRKLEDELADDEHPIPNTTKERQTITDTNLLTWISQDSNVYETTEKVIASPFDAIDRMLLQATTQEEFWDLLTLKEHLERVSVARGVMAEQKDIYDRVAKKVVIANALLARKYVVSGAEVETKLDKAWNAQFHELGKVVKCRAAAIHWTEGRNADDSVVAANKSYEFRASVNPIKPPGSASKGSSSLLKDFERYLDNLCKSGLSSLSSQEITAEERKFLEEVTDCYRRNTVSENVMRTAYLDLDVVHNQDKHQRQVEKGRAEGVRDLPEASKLSLNFADSSVRNQTIDQIKTGIAVEHIEGFYQQNDKIIRHLAGLIATETNLPPALALSTAKTCIALTYSTWSGDKEWIKLMEQKDKGRFLAVLAAVDRVNFGRSIRLSSRRAIHKALNVSAMTIAEEGFAGLYGRREAVKVELKDVLGEKIYTLAASEPLKKVLSERPGSYSPVIGYRNVDLSLEDWLALQTVNNKHFAELRTVGFIYCYLKQIEAGQQPDSRLMTELAGIKEWPLKFRIPCADMAVLMEHSPWPADHLKKLVHRYLEHQNSFEEFTDEELMSLVKVVRMAGPEEKKSVELEGEVGEEYLHRFSAQYRKDGLPPQEALIKAIKTVVDKDISLGTLRDMTLQWLGDGMRFHECFPGVTDDQVNDLLIYLSRDATTGHRQTKIYESLLLYAQIPFEKRKDLGLSDAFDLGKESIGLQAVIDKYQGEAVKWIMSNFHPSIERDMYLAALHSLATEDLKNKYAEEIAGSLVNSPDMGDARNSSTSHDLFLLRKRSTKSEDWQAGLQAWKGLGRVGENFDDLLKRRHPFATLGIRGFREFGMGIAWPRDFGSSRQRFQAERLLQIEPVIFDANKPLVERITELKKAAIHPSVVRDIHLEMMLEDELAAAKTPQERVAAGKALLPLFTSDSALRSRLGAVVFVSELNIRPELYKDFNGFLAQLTAYLPSPSLQRNHFLNLFEDAASLTSEQLRIIDSFRLSSEGKKDEQDSSPITFVVNKLSEQSREDKIQTSLWVLGLSNEKSKAILRVEKELDGHLDGLPLAVAMSTSVEREVLFKRLFLGAEGVLDLEAVPDAQIEQARRQRREFISVLAKEFLPDNMSNAALFRDIFTSVLESSDPPHASRTLVKLINSFIEAQAGGKKLPPEEVIAISLNELGVIGKKVSQSLAELDWVPDSYKKTLRRSQSEGETVPKRALMVLAEDAGLLDPNSPIRIISFDELRGAASNKQACLLTVEVTDESVGLPKGIHQVIGKFKRPSAQKRENIEHDLRVMRQIIGVLNQRGYAEALPKDFTAQISDAVNKELDFTREKHFSDQLRADLAERNTKRRQQVSIPKIYFTSEDVMLESVASGISLRAYRDLREQGTDQLISSGYGALSERVINQTIVTEGLSQLITTGNIHADLHPGNIFVDQQGNLTFIDLGMHQNLTPEQRFATISLVAGLASGNEAYLKNTLKNMGWDLGNTTLGLTRFNFTDNTLRLLRASQKSTTTPPEILTSVILASSKLGTYTSGFSSPELFKMLINALNKRETPQIIAHLIKSGVGTFFR